MSFFRVYEGMQKKPVSFLLPVIFVIFSVAIGAFFPFSARALGELYALLSVTSIVLGAVLIWIAYNKPHWGVWIVLSLFVFSSANPADPTAYARGAAGESIGRIGAHTRIMGIVSPMEILLVMFLSISILRRLSLHDWTLRLTTKIPGFVKIFLFMLVVGVVVGLLSSLLFTPIDQVSVGDLLKDLRPYLYMLSVSLLITLGIRSRCEFVQTLWLIVTALMVLAGIGVHRYFLAMAGLINVWRRWGAMNVGVGAGVWAVLALVGAWQAYLALGVRKGKVFAYLMVTVFIVVELWQILIGGSRSTYVMLMGEILAVSFLLFWWRLVPVPRLLARGVWLLLIVCLAIIVLAVSYSDALNVVGHVWEKVFDWSLSAENTSNATRVVEIQNVFLNLGRGGIFSYVFGMGLGVKWQEIVRQPRDWAAFPGEELGLGQWHLALHVPPTHIFYKFGLLGCALVVAVIWGGVKYYGGAVRRLEYMWQKSLLCSLVAAFLVLFFFAHFVNPWNGFQAGILLGLLQTLVTWNIREQAVGGV